MDNISIISNNCCGCSACVSACEINAIKWELNEEGFYRPVIDCEKCVGCGKCVKICPINNQIRHKAIKGYYGWDNRDSVIMSSSSGGVFTSLVEYAKNDGGVVFGAVFSDEFNKVFINNTNNCGWDSLKKSKYISSDANGSFTDCEKLLASGRNVVYCGSPCQIAGLTNYLGKEYDNLLKIDFVCGGFPSASFWTQHIERFEKKYHSRINYVDFRPKTKGWGKCYLELHFSNGKRVFKRDFLDTFYNCFINEHISVSEICLHCPFHDNHYSDITIADFWGYKNAGLKRREQGLSLIICNNGKGVAHVENNCSDLHYVEIDEKFYAYAVQPLDVTKIKTDKRKTFFELAKQTGFEKAANKLYPATYISHAQRWLKRFIKN